jgi:SNF2 family DNA or RNA helicase
MLDIAETALDNSGLNFIRYDGKMSSIERETALQTFNNDSSVTVAMISLKCGGVGLNLTRASKVIMLDLWYYRAKKVEPCS